MKTKTPSDRLLAAANDEERRQSWGTLSADEQSRLWDLEWKCIDPEERKRRIALLEALPGWKEFCETEGGDR